MTRKLSALAALAAVALTAAQATAQQPLLKSAATGNPEVKSIEAIAFGPQGLLLIGDSAGRQIVAVDTKDTKPVTWTKTDIPNIDGALAGRIGTTAKGIEIVKIAVNPASSRAYFAVRKLDDKKGIILTLDGDGKVNEFALDSVTYAALPLPGTSKIQRITDVVWADDRILATVQASETFGSKIFSAPVPLTHKAAGSMFSTETFHVAHNKWETKAPIYTVIPYEEAGQKYLVGAFTCTPLVKYPLNDLKPDAKVKGQTLIEVGNGNNPRDMFTYKKNGKTYILISTFRMFHQRQPVGPSPYWVVRIDHTILTEKDKVNEKAIWRTDKQLKPITDRASVVETFHGVMLMDRLGEDRALVIRTDDKGNKSLAALALP